jgi:lysophospholipase L1-like esterase
MTSPRPHRAASLLAALLLTLVPAAHAKTPPAPDHWVGTWATAPVGVDNKSPLLGAADTTLRQIVHVSIGGALARVELSNEFGTEPLTIGAAHLALAGANLGDIALTSANALTFNGSPTVIIPPGAMVVSDPAGITFPAAADLVVSILLPAQPLTHLTQHNSAYQTNVIAPGNVVGKASIDPKTEGNKTTASWYFLKGIDVLAPATTSAVVAFGDSITDGTASTPNLNGRWPDVLARRLNANKDTKDKNAIAVLNEGIGGNRVLHDTTGPSALARFDRDVLSQSGVKYLIILESINDIGHSFDLVKPYDPITAEDLIQGFVQLVDRAHMHGIQVFLATATPYVGAKYASPAGEQCRQAVNQWIRTNHLADGFIDFDQATRDSANPGAFAAAFDHGDHLHPNDAGLKAMGDAIDLKLFKPTK